MNKSVTILENTAQEKFVPLSRLYIRGTVGQEKNEEKSGTSLGTSTGTTSLKALARAILRVPLDENARDKPRDKGKNLVPRLKEALGQESVTISPKNEKDVLEKYDLPVLQVDAPCPEQKASGQEWVAVACACKFRDCTLWTKDKQPVECRWNGEGV